MEKSEVIVFNGVKYRRYPQSEKWADRMYYVPNASYRKRGYGRLHQEIWKAAYGEIPTGHEIHHKDKNPLNNALDNLECISEAEHHQIHTDDMSDWKRKWLQERMAVIRPLANNWHSSPEGREWHKLLGAMSWELIEEQTLVCEHCGKEFRVRVAHQRTRFCSNACKSAYRRKLGVDNEERSCATCGKTFTINRYAKRKYCSSACAPSKRKT